MIVNAHSVTFDGVDLHSITGVTVLKTDPYKLPRRDVSMSRITRTDQSYSNTANYVERIIVVSVGISRNTRSDLERSVDDLMAILQGVNKPLIMDQAGSTRVYYATLEDAPVEEDGGSYIKIDLTFTCVDRYGYGPTQLTLLTIGTTTAYSRVDSLNFVGSAKQAPLFTITYSSITDGTDETVMIGNGNSSQEISITRVWASSDVITIKTGNQPYVRVNGVDVEFSGSFPLFETGSQTWYYEDTFTARTFTGSIVYTPRYT